MVARIELGFIDPTRISPRPIRAGVEPARLAYFGLFFYFRFFNDYIIFSNY